MLVQIFLIRIINGLEIGISINCRGNFEETKQHESSIDLIIIIM